MDFKKQCQWCGKPFIAHKMTALYCSSSCINKAYKARRKQKIWEQMEDGQNDGMPIIGSIGQKPFLSPKEAATLLGVSKATLYRYMAQRMFRVLRTPARTIIRWSDLEAMFDKAPAYVKRNNRKHKVEAATYAMTDITEKYHVTRKVAMKRIERFNIAKIYEGRNVSYPKAAIDRYFGELIEEFNKDDYYTIAQIMEKFDMTHSAILSYVARHKVPRVTRHREVFYSKVHIDCLKGTGEAVDPLYYTYKEVMEKYGFSKDQIGYCLHAYHIDRFKRGSYTMINRKDFDKIIAERMNGFQSISEINFKMEDAKALRAEDERTASEDLVEIIPYAEDDGGNGDDKCTGKVQGYINAEEISERYKQSKKWVHYLTRQKKIPRMQKAGVLFYDEKVVEETFNRYASADGITEWYTTDDIEEKYNITPAARRSFTHRHNIPTKKEYGITYYSKLHVDFAKNPGLQYAEDYYMVEQIMSKYHVNRETVYGMIRYKKIPAVKDGRYSLYLKSAIDKFFTDKAGTEEN